MSDQIKGCLQLITKVKRIPSTSPNRRKIGGGTVRLTLACGHIKETRASALSRGIKHQEGKKAQCYVCVAERNADVTGEYRS